MLSKVLSKIKTWQSEIILTIAVILIAVIAFESGKISASKSFYKPLEIKDSQAAISHTPLNSQTKSNPTTTVNYQKSDLWVVASKNSTSYHFLWCSGAKRIKEENRVYFSSEQEAQSKGYTLASNCQR